jgi:hypothetical protein
MAQEGTIRIYRLIGGTGAAFRVSFVPYSTEKEGEVGMRSPAELTREVLRQLAAGRSASLPNVSLSDQVVKSSGLETATSPAKRRNVAA